MPRTSVRVSKTGKKSDSSAGNLNKYLERLDSPTFNEPLRLTRGVNRRNGVLSHKFPSRSQGASPSKRNVRSVHKSSTPKQQFSDAPQKEDTVQSGLMDPIEDGTEEVLESIMEAIQLELGTQQKINADTFSKNKRNRQWKDSIKKYEELWNVKSKELFEYCTAYSSVTASFCFKCKRQIFQIIDCTTCKQKLCQDCDSKFHFDHPFHCRKLLEGLQVLSLKPTNFILNDQLKQRSI